MRFVLDPELTLELREQLVGLWTDVSNAGGAVGFAGAVTRAQVEEVAGPTFEGVDAGIDRLIVGYDEDGAAAAMAILVSKRFALSAHWRTVGRVMVHPGRQGRGEGAALMREAERVGRAMGLEGLHITVRGGMGLERFYTPLGYKEVGRLPGALRMAPGDDRDEIEMWLDLS
ncbi:GNAT family N-acetyltransferase [Catellatospora bangladeshensis]|uniref:N-acetyltransferase n=1 Tax=Catellatospora bangladeshensis TaxID=310355 RepID=A0A8J3NL95_9ACTN|nr:GNAT family N-acetyltransferase [Catellatospora bangladeshensis]GIF84777.1 N-acetyltransferase [Catellatospora bangladeshensis]